MFVEQFGPEPDGATPLTEEDYLGLIPNRLTNRGDLNQVETVNIVEARNKYLFIRLEPRVVLDDFFVRKLHSDMYANVWTWAGQYRNRNQNIGVDFQSVLMQVADLMADG